MAENAVTPGQEPDQNASAVEPRRVVVPKAKERQLWDAPEPGFYRDPETGWLHRCRWNRRRTRKEPPVKPYRRIDE